MAEDFSKQMQRQAQRGSFLETFEKEEQTFEAMKQLVTNIEEHVKKLPSPAETATTTAEIDAVVEAKELMALYFGLIQKTILGEGELKEGEELLDAGKRVYLSKLENGRALVESGAITDTILNNWTARTHARAVEMKQLRARISAAIGPYRDLLFPKNP